MHRNKLIFHYGTAWSKTTDAGIRSSLNEFWTPASTYTDPITDAVTGFDEMVAHVLAFPRQFPGFSLGPTSALDSHHHVGRFSWLMQADGNIHANGIDYGTTLEGFDYVEFAGTGSSRLSVFSVRFRDHDLPESPRARREWRVLGSRPLPQWHVQESAAGDDWNFRQVRCAARTRASAVMRKTLAPLLLVLAALAIGGPSHAAEPVEFTPAAGFGGESEGNGTLKLLLGKPRPFHVRSRGTEQDDGSFRLAQTITFEGESPQDRVWVISTVGPNRYSATLSDAAGPVTGITSGSRLSLRYRVRGPLVMHQELELMPDGKTIDNVATLTLLGVPVGRLQETITRSLPAIATPH